MPVASTIVLETTSLDMKTGHVTPLGSVKPKGKKMQFQPRLQLLCFSNNTTHRHPHTLMGPETYCPQPPFPLIVYSGQEVVSW